MLPAHFTKDVALLSVHLTHGSGVHLKLAQKDDGMSNGTGLWMGGQCLSAYLIENKNISRSIRSNGQSLRVIELGSGIGLTALVMSTLGWDIIATDTEKIIQSVLNANIERNTGGVNVTVKELDWTVPPDRWIWDNECSIASHNSNGVQKSCLKDPFDLIVTADTVYEASLIDPLLRTLHNLCISSQKATTSQKNPPVLVCLERRDTSVIDRLLYEAQHTWRFKVQRIPDRKLYQCMKKSGMHWEKADWEGVELWKMSLIEN